MYPQIPTTSVKNKLVFTLLIVKTCYVHFAQSLRYRVNFSDSWGKKNQFEFVSTIRFKVLITSWICLGMSMHCLLCYIVIYVFDNVGDKLNRNKMCIISLTILLPPLKRRGCGDWKIENTSNTVYTHTVHSVLTVYTEYISII